MTALEPLRYVGYCDNCDEKKTLELEPDGLTQDHSGRWQRCSCRKINYLHREQDEQRDKDHIRQSGFIVDADRGDVIVL